MDKIGDSLADANYGVHVDHARYGRRAPSRPQYLSVHQAVAIEYEGSEHADWICEFAATDFVIIGRFL